MNRFNRLFVFVFSLFLVGCGCCDRLQFSDIGNAFIENGKLCIGTNNKADVLTFYNIGKFGLGVDSSEDGVLSTSGRNSIALTYPDTCIKVALNAKPGVHYHVSYILNGNKFRYEFDYLSNGSIVDYKPLR